MPPVATVFRPARRPKVRPGLVLGIILAVQLMVVLDATIVNIALPGIASSLNFSPASLSWVITAYTLAFGGFLLLGAAPATCSAASACSSPGIGLFTFASFLGGLAPNGGLLLAARALQGVGGALAAPSALAFLMIMFPEGRERLRALGYYTAVSIGGGAIGLILGGLLTQVASGAGCCSSMCRWAWSCSCWRAGRSVRRRAATATSTCSGRDLDRRRHLARVRLRPCGEQRLGRHADLRRLRAGRRAAGGVRDPRDARLGADHAAGAVRGPQPQRLLRGRLFLVAGMFGMFFFMTQFLQDVLGYGPLETGLAFLPFSLALFGCRSSARGG